MDTFVAGHIRKVWASSKSKCRIHDVHTTMDAMYIYDPALSHIDQTMANYLTVSILFLHTCVRTVSMCSVSAVSKLFSYGSRIHIYF